MKFINMIRIREYLTTSSDEELALKQAELEKISEWIGIELAKRKTQVYKAKVSFNDLGVVRLG